MGVNLKRKRGSSAMEVVMVMVALVLLIYTNSCGASSILKSNMSNYRQCISTRAMDGCLIGNDLDLDLDFFMDTHVILFLDESEHKKSRGGGGGTLNTGNPGRKACYSETGEKYTCDVGKKNTKSPCKGKYCKS